MHYRAYFIFMSVRIYLTCGEKHRLENPTLESYFASVDKHFVRMINKA
ncbi:hypothetical protein [uncultured Helicobacter sp.]|nr:hypothetical protein [uncultured Helicobacter sp.]